MRYLAVLFGGMMAGLGGAYLSLAYTPMWIEQMTAGRGWIALALVVFAAWRPVAPPDRRLPVRRCHHPAAAMPRVRIGFGVPSQVMSMLPYLATIHRADHDFQPADPGAAGSMHRPASANPSVLQHT